MALYTKICAAAVPCPGVPFGARNPDGGGGPVGPLLVLFDWAILFLIVVY